MNSNICYTFEIEYKFGEQTISCSPFHIILFEAP